MRYATISVATSTQAAIFPGGGIGPKDNVALARVEKRMRKSLPPEKDWVYSDPLEEAARLRAEADAWRRTCRDMVDKLTDFEVREVWFTDDSKMVEKVGAELRAIVRAYTDSLDRCFTMAATAVRLGLQERYVDQLDRHAQLFARVLAEGMRLLAIDVPPERYAQVIPLAIAAVREEIDGQS